jgi:hypothetical protein
MSFLQKKIAQFFGKMTFKQLQDGVRFQFFLKKLIERRTLIQKSLFLHCYSVLFEKIEMQKFPNFENLRILSKSEFLF